MKRTRAEPNRLSKLPSLSPKAQKKSSPNPKPVRARKPDKAGGRGGSPAAPAAAAAAAKEELEEKYLYPTAEGYPSESKEVERLGLSFGDGEGFGLWSGSVEEEVLLGWFPWAGPVLGVQEDEEEVDFDIWHLQQIQEIPSTPK